MSDNDSELFNVDINNYNGPLDVLLDLAKAQKVDFYLELQKKNLKYKKLQKN